MLNHIAFSKSTLWKIVMIVIKETRYYICEKREDNLKWVAESIKLLFNGVK